MTTIRLFVGLDYHNKWVQACVLDSAGAVLVNRRVQNDSQGIGDVVRGVALALGVRTEVYAAIEVSTGAASLAEELVAKAAWSVHLAHPGYVARMKRNPDKHDMGDAHLLADLERVGYLPRVWLAPPELRELRRLVRYRQQLADQRRNAKLRIQALLRDHRVRGPGRAWSRPWMHWIENEVRLPEQSRWILQQHLSTLERLEKELETVHRRLRKTTAKDQLVKSLLKQSGIGEITAWVVRSEIGRFDRFRSGKQLSKFCGLSPRNASSGERQADAGLVPTGNRQLRATLIEAAHRLARYDPRWSALAKSLREKGKKGSVVAAAVGNRWIRWLFHQMQPPRLAA